MPHVYAVLNGALTPKAGAAHHDEKPWLDIYGEFE
jgi:hypothetical protein